MDAPKQQSKSEHIWAQFSAEDFDAKQWVNNVLRTRKDKEPDTSVDVSYNLVTLQCRRILVNLHLVGASFNIDFKAATVDTGKILDAACATMCILQNLIELSRLS